MINIPHQGHRRRRARVKRREERILLQAKKENPPLVLRFVSQFMIFFFKSYLTFQPLKFNSRAFVRKYTFAMQVGGTNSEDVVTENKRKIKLKLTFIQRPPQTQSALYGSFGPDEPSRMKREIAPPPPQRHHSGPIFVSELH